MNKLENLPDKGTFSLLLNVILDIFLVALPDITDCIMQMLESLQLS